MGTTTSCRSCIGCSTWARCLNAARPSSIAGSTRENKIAKRFGQYATNTHGDWERNVLADCTNVHFAQLEQGDVLETDAGLLQPMPATPSLTQWCTDHGLVGDIKRSSVPSLIAPCTQHFLFPIIVFKLSCVEWCFS